MQHHVRVCTCKTELDAIKLILNGALSVEAGELGLTINTTWHSDLALLTYASFLCRYYYITGYSKMAEQRIRELGGLFCSHLWKYPVHAFVGEIVKGQLAESMLAIML